MISKRAMSASKSSSRRASGNTQSSSSNGQPSEARMNRYHDDIDNSSNDYDYDDDDIDDDEDFYNSNGEKRSSDSVTARISMAHNNRGALSNGSDTSGHPARTPTPTSSPLSDPLDSKKVRDKIKAIIWGVTKSLININRGDFERKFPFTYPLYASLEWKLSNALCKRFMASRIVSHCLHSDLMEQDKYQRGNHIVHRLRHCAYNTEFFNMAKTAFEEDMVFETRKEFAYNEDALEALARRKRVYSSSLLYASKYHRHKIPGLEQFTCVLFGDNASRDAHYLTVQGLFLQWLYRPHIIKPNSPPDINKTLPSYSNLPDDIKKQFIQRMPPESYKALRAVDKFHFNANNMKPTHGPMLKFKNLFDGLIRQTLVLCRSKDPYECHPYSFVWYKWFINDVKVYVEALITFTQMMINKTGSPSLLGRFYVNHFVNSHIPLEMYPGVYPDDFFHSHVRDSLSRFIQEKGAIKLTAKAVNTAQEVLEQHRQDKIMSRANYHIAIDFFESIEGKLIDNQETLDKYATDFFESNFDPADASDGSN